MNGLNKLTVRIPADLSFYLSSVYICWIITLFKKKFRTLKLKEEFKKKSKTLYIENMKDIQKRNISNFLPKQIFQNIATLLLITCGIPYILFTN